MRVLEARTILIKHKICFFLQCEKKPWESASPAFKQKHSHKSIKQRMQLHSVHIHWMRLCNSRCTCRRGRWGGTDGMPIAQLVQDGALALQNYCLFLSRRLSRELQTRFALKRARVFIQSISIRLSSVVVRGAGINPSEGCVSPSLGCMGCEQHSQCVGHEHTFHTKVTDEMRLCV